MLQCNAPSLRGCTVRVTVGSHIYIKGFLNYLSAIVVFLNVVFKDEIVFKELWHYKIQKKKKIIRNFQKLQKDNNNNKLLEWFSEA